MNTMHSDAFEFNVLVDWLEGRLPQDHAAEISARMAHADEKTLDNVAWLRAFLNLSARFMMQTPPAEMQAEVSRRFGGVQFQPMLERP